MTNLTIFMLKDTVNDFKSCLKHPERLITMDVKEQFNMEAKIYYCESNKKAPIWKEFLDNYSVEEIKISENTSNKAVMLVRIRERIMALVFGYGRSLIKEEYIEQDFGLKVSLNIINPQKMRSVNAAQIEDMVVNTQKQSSYSTSQEEFDLNVMNYIMMGVTGEPYDNCYGSHVSGKDSLSVAVEMEAEDLGEKLHLYYNAFSSERYKDIGFEWVDNIAEVRDSVLVDELNNETVSAIEQKNLRNMHIAPPETINWDQIVGFCYTGMGLNKENPENYTLNPDFSDYIAKIKPETNVYQKLKRDSLMGINDFGNIFTICSIYKALTYQLYYKNNNYILYSGKWYVVDRFFFDKVNKYVTTRIKLSDIVLPVCGGNTKEGEYNEMAVSENNKFCLMDKKMIGVENGPKKIEACDIFTVDKQLIHVKNKVNSSQLSHLFSQGKVSAECFASDENFRRQVEEITYKSFGNHIFDYRRKPESGEFEIVYAIIDKPGSTVLDLPFFSKVNLMLTSGELDRMHFKHSICFVEKKNKIYDVVCNLV